MPNMSERENILTILSNKDMSDFILWQISSFFPARKMDEGARPANKRACK